MIESIIQTSVLKANNMTPTTSVLEIIFPTGIQAPVGTPVKQLPLVERLKVAEVTIEKSSITVKNRKTHAKGSLTYLGLPNLQEGKISAGELIEWYRQQELLPHHHPCTRSAISASVTNVCLLFAQTELSFITTEEQACMQHYDCKGRWTPVQCLCLHLTDII